MPSSTFRYTTGDGHHNPNSGNLNFPKPDAVKGTGASSSYGINCNPPDRGEEHNYQQEPMGFQQHQQQYQTQPNQLQQQDQEQNQRQQHHRQQQHNFRQQHHSEMQKIQLQHEHQQHLLQQQRQSQASSRSDLRGLGASQIKGYIDPNRFHQQQQEQQHLQLKLQLQQQGEHIQQHRAQLQNYQLQHALPHHSQRQHHAGGPGSFGSMAETLRQQQHHLLASATSANHPIWGVAPPGVSPRHPHLLDRELPSRNENGVASRKRNLTAVSGGSVNQVGMNWKNPKIDSKQAMRSEKKREQEKQRRSDLNEKFAALIHVVKRIETEDEDVERKRAQAEEALRKKRADEEAKEQDEQAKTKTTKEVNEEGIQEDPGSDNFPGEGPTSVAESTRKKQMEDMTSISVSSIAELISAERRSFKRRFPCFISPSNRSDLIARAVCHLMKYSKIRNKLNGDLDTMRKEVEEVTRRNEESERKLKHIENVAMMANSSTNSMAVTSGDGNGEGPNGAEICSTETCKPSPSATATKDGLQPPQQQQQPQMMMMMPMIMNSDGSFNQQVPQQFMSMPMASMGAHLFNNMMMMPQLPQATAPTSTEPQDQQQRQQEDKASQQDEQKSHAQPEDGSSGANGKPMGSTVPEDVEREATEDPSAVCASTSPPSPIGNQKDKLIDDSMTCTQPKSDCSLLDDSKQNSYQNKLPGQENPPQPPLLDSEDHISVDNESKTKLPANEETKSEAQSKENQQEIPTSTNLEIKEEIERPAATVAQGTEIEMESACLDVTQSSKGASDKPSSESPSQVTTLVEPRSNSSSSPATNMPNPERKLFPSPATPSPETVLIENKIETVNATKAIELDKGTNTNSPSPAKVNQEIEETSVKQEPENSKVQTDENDTVKKDEGPSQTTESLASTLLGLAGLSKYSK